MRRTRTIRLLGQSTWVSSHGCICLARFWSASSTNLGFCPFPRLHSLAMIEAQLNFQSSQTQWVIVCYPIMMNRYLGLARRKLCMKTIRDRVERVRATVSASWDTSFFGARHDDAPYLQFNRQGLSCFRSIPDPIEVRNGNHGLLLSSGKKVDEEFFAPSRVLTRMLRLSVS